MFGSIGGPELLLILVIALIVFGPRKLPEMGKSLGKMLVEFRRASNEFKRTIEDEVEAEKVKEQVQPVPAALTGPSGALTPPAETPSPGEPVLGTPDGGLGAEPRSGESPQGPSAGIHSRREPPAGTVPSGDAAGEPH